MRNRPAPGNQDMRLAGAAGLLLIIDYADRWLLTNLTWLLKNTMLHQEGVPTRILMLARTQDGWPAIRGILDPYQAGTSSRFLPGLAWRLRTAREHVPGGAGQLRRRLTACRTRPASSRRCL